MNLKECFTATVICAICLLVGVGRISSAADLSNAKQEDPTVSPGEQRKYLTLEDAFRLAFERNEEIRIAFLVAQESGLLPWRVVSEILPHVQSNGSIIYPKEEISFDNSPIVADPRKDASITVSQRVFDGQVVPGLMRARGQRNAGDADRRFDVRNFLFEVAEAYFKLLKNQQLVAVSEETVKLAQEQHRILAERYERGQAPKTDLLRAEVEVSRAERILFATENNRRFAASNLARLIGVSRAEIRDVRIEGHEAVASPALESEVQLQQYIETGLASRNDLKKLEEEKNSAKWALRQAQFSLLPRADLELEQSWLDPETFSERNDFWKVFLKLSFPIFEGGSRFIDIKEKRYQLRQAVLRHEQHRKKVALEIEEAWLACKTKKTNLEAVQKELELSRENYAVILDRYEAGQVTSLDVVNGFTELASAQTNAVNETFDYELANLNLLRMSGRFGKRYDG
jgi:outer membrane protein